MLNQASKNFSFFWKQKTSLKQKGTAVFSTQLWFNKQWFTSKFSPHNIQGFLVLLQTFQDHVVQLHLKRKIRLQWNLPARSYPAVPKEKNRWYQACKAIFSIPKGAILKFRSFSPFLVLKFLLGASQRAKHFVSQIKHQKLPQPQDSEHLLTPCFWFSFCPLHSNLTPKYCWLF